MGRIAEEAPSNTYTYNGQQYDASYEPWKDTSMSYADRMRLQAAKDEAIRDSQMTMSMEDAMKLVSGGYTTDQDLAGGDYKQAYDRITDAFENPNAMGDMTDEQVTQLQRLASGSTAGNLYNIARANGSGSQWMDTDLSKLLSEAGKEAVNRYGTGIFTEDYAADPTSPDVGGIGAGELAEQIRNNTNPIQPPTDGGIWDAIGGGSAPPTADDIRGPNGGGGGAPEGGYYPYTPRDPFKPYTDVGVDGPGSGSPWGQPNKPGDNQQFYRDQFQGLVSQNNRLMSGQADAAEARYNAESERQANFKPYSGDPWGWVEGGLPGIDLYDSGYAAPLEGMQLSGDPFIQGNDVPKLDWDMINKSLSRAGLGGGRGGNGNDTALV